MLAVGTVSIVSLILRHLITDRTGIGMLAA